MNLNKLFKAQAELDKRIVNDKGLEGRDLLDKKILALLVELGELANEWRGFKFWSEDQEPNIIYCHACNGHGLFDTGLVEENMPYRESCGYCQATGVQENPLLEEYVDCLHFILSIANELNYEYDEKIFNSTEYQFDDVTQTFINTFGSINELFYDNYSFGHEYNIEDLILTFFTLGKQLGFTWKEIEKAYFDKNKVNHERQANGY